MSSGVPAALRRLVIDRAEGRCEYCGLSQVGQEAAFHVDHVTPRKSGSSSEPQNLALACVSCSLRKAARQAAVDPETLEEVALFNPRQNSWPDHFKWQGVVVHGVTPTGRATIDALQMNRPLAVAIRREEAELGRHRSE